jgi:hypothetical protein
MKKKLLLVLAFVFVSSISTLGLLAQAKSTEKVKIVLSKSDVLSKIDEIYNTLKTEKEDKPLQPTQFVNFASFIKTFVEYPALEKTTSIRKDWFVKLGKIVTAMETCRINFKVATLNKDKELYLKSKQYYAKCLEAFETTYKNPEKIKITR